MKPHPATTAKLTEPELDEIRTLIEQRSAILFDSSRERFFSTRVREHLEEKGLASGTELLRHVRASSIEYEALLERLLTQETSFFRYPAVYEALEKRICLKCRSGNFGKLRGRCASGARAARRAKSLIRSRSRSARR